VLFLQRDRKVDVGSGTQKMRKDKKLQGDKKYDASPWVNMTHFKIKRFSFQITIFSK
jgi:hypothetical protein